MSLSKGLRTDLVNGRRVQPEFFFALIQLCDFPMKLPAKAGKFFCVDFAGLRRQISNPGLDKMEAAP
jgi:hypothetical protein